MCEWLDRVESRCIEKGIAQGLEKGIAQGLEKGLAQGLEKGLAQGITQGIAEGKRRSAVSNAITMLKDGLGIEKTSLYSSLPIDEVIALSKEIGVVSV